jgi:hypothetical protein
VGRRPERVGGLERVPALDATTTLETAADLDVKGPHRRAHDRDIDLQLFGGVSGL